MSCLDIEKLISARLDRELSTEETAGLEEHLAGCEACRRAAGEYAALVGELESAFRAEPLAAAGPARRPRRVWLQLAAAVLLIAGGAAGAYFFRSRPPTPPPPARGPEVVQLESGTRVVTKGAARVDFAGAQNGVDEVIHLEEGEIEVFAAKAAPGRRAVRVVTRLGEVETLGTVFTVKLENAGEEGGQDMKLRKLAPLTALVMLVGVSEGRVLVRGALGEAVVYAGETAEVGDGKLAVGKTDRIIKGKVTEVGEKGATVSVGKADGLKVGFELTCKAKLWTGKVITLAENSAVLEVKGKAAVGDVVETKLTTVLTEAPKGDPTAKPAPVATNPVKAGPKVEGLQLTLVEKEIVRKYTYYVTVDGKPVREGQGVKVPEGAEKKTREYKYKTLVVQLKNVGEEAVVLPLIYAYRGGQTFKLFARDAEGNAVPRREYPAYAKPKGGKKTAEGPVTVTILKPGQVIERSLYGTYTLKFPKEGKYTLWAEYEVEAAGDGEVLPGVKMWSGKLKSNEIEYEYKPRTWARYGGAKPAPGAAKKPVKKEVF